MQLFYNFYTMLQAFGTVHHVFKNAKGFYLLLNLIALRSLLLSHLN